jgi:hypothetical protein
MRIYIYRLEPRYRYRYRYRYAVYFPFCVLKTPLSKLNAARQGKALPRVVMD